MILTDLFESPEIHNQDRLDSVLGRCIELIHEKNGTNPKKYGKVAACIIDIKNRKVFGINSPGANGTRRHAERMAIDAYHKRYGKILPGAIIVTTLSPCNREMAERDGPSCQDLLMQAGIEKVYSGYMDPSQHSDHPFTEELTKNDDLWRRCKEFSDSFVHDDLTESQHNTMAADQVLDYVKRTHAPEEFDIEYSITDHPEWELKTIPLSQLNLDPDGEATDPYNRVNWVDDDKVQELIPRIGSVLKSRPIVVDTEGWIIDGNHRAMAAAEAGLTSVPALVPVKHDMTENMSHDQDGRAVAEGKITDTAITLSRLGKFHSGEDTLAEFVPERSTVQYALHPDKWESTFYSLTNKDSDKVRYYGPKKIAIPPGTLVGDMAIANKFYRAKTTQEKQHYAELYRQSLKSYPVDVSEYRMPELLIPKQGVAEGLEQISIKARKGHNKFATELSVDGKTAGVYQYDANSGRSIAEVYPEYRGKGFGKILVLHAIYTAAKLGMDFVEDESRTAEYDNVLDSLDSNGLAVNDDGYWYVTGEGEQYLKQHLKQGMAEGNMDGKVADIKGQIAELEAEQEQNEFGSYAYDTVDGKLQYLYAKLDKAEKGVAENKQPGKPVVDAILKVMPLAQEIWFHGSRAIGQHRDDSDTDILVVVPDDLVGDKYLGVVRILQKLSSHFDNHDIQPTKAGTNIHRIAQEEGRLLWSKNRGVTENFADGRVKGKSRPGRVKRSGASCAGSVTDLRAKARKYGGERGKMYHWCANMKGGKK